MLSHPLILYIISIFVPIMLHRFTTDISNIERPQMLNNPFYYEPDELAIEAWRELSLHLDNTPEYHD